MRHESAIVEHVEQLQLVLDRAQLGTFDYDLRTRQVSLSAQTCRIYGIPVRRQASLDELLDLIEPEDRPVRERALQAALAPGANGVYEVEFRLKPTQGSRWVRVRGRVVVDPAHPGTPTRVVGIVSDVTAEKSQQESLEQVSAMLNAIGDSTDALMYAKDRQGRVLYCNAACLAALGKAREEVIGRTVQEFMPPGPETDALVENDRQVMERGQGLQFTESLQANGRSFVTSKTPFRDRQGRIVGLTGVSIDITELHRAREALRESEERAAMAAEAAEIGIYEYDPFTDQLSWSDTVRRQFGVDLGEVVSLPKAVERIHPDDRERVVAAVQKAMDPAGDGDYNIEYRTVPVQGEVRWLHVLGRVRFEERAGRRVAVRFAGVTINITQRKALEDALREADRRKDQFLAMLAHELRNPLAPLTYVGSMLERGPVPPERLSAVTDVIRRQTQHMARLVDDLLDASRITLGKISVSKEHILLQDVLQGAIASSLPSPQQSRRTLLTDIEPAPLPVDGDPVRLTQLVSNLLNNAVKFTREGGQIRVSLQRAGDEGVLVVEDDGQGIPTDLLPHVFDLFVQADNSLDRKSGGLGIGLSLVRAIAQLHGGAVCAESAGPGQGARFTVRLPLVARVHTPAPPPATVQDAFRARRILVVEDNPDSAETLKLMLQMWGHDVQTASDGRAGLRAASQSVPDVMLIDIGLPGMTGFELARRLREDAQLSQTRLVALTGYGSDADRLEASRAGFHFHLVKPVRPEELERVLQ